MIFTTVVLATCIVAVVTDLTSRRIPNWLTAALACFALASHATAGWVSLGASVAIMLAVTGLGLFAFKRGWLGGGDVKLLAAGAAALGWPDCIAFLVYTSFAGGIISLAVLLRQRRAWSTVRNIVGPFFALPFGDAGNVRVAKPIMLPYACAIACGAVFVALAQSIAPFLRLSL